MAAKNSKISGKVLKWYDRHRRHLPWRAAPGEPANPYHVWLSEIMLQQTTVATVKSYFEQFLKIWPEVEDLANAPLDDVLHAWQGLGYYARARNLHKCAKLIVTEYEGDFPNSESELLILPGIGPYTAAALASIAFGQKATPVDGNIERVMARLNAITEALPKAKPKLKKLAVQFTPAKRAGDYAQALMDIGATICTPKNAKCDICPLNSDCQAAAEGLADKLPKRQAKKPKPTRRGTAYWLVNSNREILLRRRPEKGLLGGMIEVPSSVWLEGKSAGTKVKNEAPIQTDWEALPGVVRHTFTHFHLELAVVAGRCSAAKHKTKGIWCGAEEFDQHALPTVMKKVVAHAQKHAKKHPH
ncbi:MAG: A/G-specific adenine glycosylase [Rhodospirillaceae bacterium]|nr:A/G-specific adenine glycosylase [Rhodospirillaceae bacterium]